MCLSGDSQEDTKEASSLSFFVLFSSPVDPIQALLITSFSSFQMFSHVGAPLNHPLLAIQLFRSAQDISKIHVSTLLSFKLFRGCYLIQAI